LELASEDVWERKEMSLLLAFGKPDNERDECQHKYTRFFVEKEGINPNELLRPLPKRPTAFGNLIIEQVCFC
jgi:hypothetical protein